MPSTVALFLQQLLPTSWMACSEGIRMLPSSGDMNTIHHYDSLGEWWKVETLSACCLVPAIPFQHSMTPCKPVHLSVRQANVFCMISSSGGFSHSQLVSFAWMAPFPPVFSHQASLLHLYPGFPQFLEYNRSLTPPGACPRLVANAKKMNI